MLQNIDGEGTPIKRLSRNREIRIRRLERYLAQEIDDLHRPQNGSRIAEMIEESEWVQWSIKR